MASARISVRLDSHTQNRLKEEVTASGRSESEIVRLALLAYLSKGPKRESCFDLAKRHGLIGAVKGLPPDLSSNRDHFEGFGR